MAIAIIPARGGSQRIPRKNIRLFHGKPIIAYSIETAQKSGLFDRIVVSTDDHDIAELATKYGAEMHWRDADSARDEIGTQEVAARVLEYMDIQYGIACVIYATAPMLTSATLVAAFHAWRNVESLYLVPVATWLQDPGQFYFGYVHAFLYRSPLIDVRTVLYQIPPETECDINTLEDFERAEQMYLALRGNNGN